MPTIFVLNGQGKAGKDTFAKFAMHYLNKEHRMLTAVISSVDMVKIFGQKLGWDGVKDEKGRKFLSDLKELSTRYNGPMKYMAEYIETCGAHVVFVHIREPEEIKKLVDRYPSAITVLLNRGKSLKLGNISDDDVENYVYDHYIENNDTEQQLEKKAKELMNLTVISFT